MAKIEKSYVEVQKEIQTDDTVTEEGFGTNKKVSSSYSIFTMNYDEDRTVGTYILEECYNILDVNTTLNDEQIRNIIPYRFLYRFGTTSQRVHSDSDNKTTAEGVYFHEWLFDTEFDAEGSPYLQQKEINTWLVEANRNVWYIITLVVSFVLVAAFFTFDYFRKKKKSKKDDVIDIQ